MVEGLGKLADVALTLTAPARLIDLLLEGSIDAGLISLIDAQRSSLPLALLPVGMIASDGPTMTVRLFSRCPIREIRSVGVDADSHTSVALLRLILARQFNVRPRVTELDIEGRLGAAALASASADDLDAVLIIGDKVVTSAPSAERYGNQIDLGEQWKAMTGLPFVYAVWMCRADQEQEPWVSTAGAVLDRQRRHNATRLDWIVGARAPLRGWNRDRAREYLGSSLQYEITDRHRAAVEMFFDLCAQDGLIAERRPTLWTDGAALGAD
jgi:chorismate dehydratase